MGGQSAPLTLVVPVLAINLEVLSPVLAHGHFDQPLFSNGEYRGSNRSKLRPLVSAAKQISTGHFYPVLSAQVATGTYWDTVLRRKTRGVSTFFAATTGAGGCGDLILQSFVSPHPLVVKRVAITSPPVDSISSFSGRQLW